MTAKRITVQQKFGVELDRESGLELETAGIVRKKVLLFNASGFLPGSPPGPFLHHVDKGGSVESEKPAGMA